MFNAIYSEHILCLLDISNILTVTNLIIVLVLFLILFFVYKNYHFRKSIRRREDDCIFQNMPIIYVRYRVVSLKDGVVTDVVLDDANQEFLNFFGLTGEELKEKSCNNYENSYCDNLKDAMTHVLTEKKTFRDFKI